MRRGLKAWLALIAVTALINTVHPASAAPTGTPFSPSELVYDTCGDGADCSGEATADVDGNQIASSSISRSSPNTTTEWIGAWASGRKSVV